MTFPEYRADHGYSDLITQHTVMGPPRTTRTKFLVTQCKRVSYEGHDWTPFIAQAQGYWRDLPVPTTAINRRKFAIIAVGRYVEFFEWNRQLGRLLPLEGIEYNRYHIQRECNSVQNALEYIKANS
jgi:hypothetical protein